MAWLGFASAVALAAPPASAWELKAGLDGLRVVSSDHSLEARLGARFDVDAAFFDEDETDLDHDVEIRRLRPELSLRVADAWRFKIDAELRPRSDPRVRNLYVGYWGFERSEIRLGNQLSRLGLEGRTGSSDFPFMERSLANAISPGTLTGLSARHWGRVTRPGPAYHASLGLFMEPLGRREDDKQDAEGLSVVGRLSFAPWEHENSTLHFGLSGQYRDVSGGGEYRIRSRPGSFTASRLVDTGTLEDVTRALTGGVELAWAWGPLTLQGEYLRTELSRSRSPDPSFDGAYVFAALLLTGEHRKYRARAGGFGRVKPKRSWGALEAALRWSTLDLQDSGVRGGDQDDVTLGLNWYVNRNMRVMFNFISVDANRRRDGRQDRPEIYQLRFQLDI